MDNKKRAICLIISAIFFLVAFIFLSMPFVTTKLGVVEFTGFDIVKHFFKSDNSKTLKEAFSPLLAILYLSPIFGLLTAIGTLFLVVFVKGFQKSPTYSITTLLIEGIGIAIGLLLSIILNFFVLAILGIQDNQLVKIGDGAILTGVFEMIGWLLIVPVDILPMLIDYEKKQNQMENIQSNFSHENRNNTNEIIEESSTVNNVQITADTIEHNKIGSENNDKLYEQLKQLKVLNDEGLISNEEYEAKKKQLLGL